VSIAGAPRVLQFFHARPDRSEALLGALRRRGEEILRVPSGVDASILRDESTPDRVATLDTFSGSPDWAAAVARSVPPAVEATGGGLVIEPPVVRPLVTLWEREFEREGPTIVMAEILTHASTARRFADLLMPLALRGVGEFPLAWLRICQVRDEPARFFVMAALPSPAVRDAYIASSFRRDEVLPIIGPYLVGRVGRHSMTLVWSARAG
jgi:hypothetical protein